jgi:membrane-associated protein
MISTLTAAVVAAVSALHGPALYALVGALAFGEAAAFLGLVLPGETAVFLGAALAAQEHGHLAVLIAVVAVAAIAGDSVGYEIGRALGPRLRGGRLGRWIGPARWRRADQMVAARGATAVVLGRWVGILRALVPAVAGATRMSYGRFLLANAVGGISWAVIVSLLGYGAGTAWPQVQAWLGRGWLTVAALVLAALLARTVVRRRRGSSPGRDLAGLGTSDDRAERGDRALRAVLEPVAR